MCDDAIEARRMDRLVCFLPIKEQVLRKQVSTLVVNVDPLSEVRKLPLRGEQLSIFGTCRTHGCVLLQLHSILLLDNPASRLWEKGFRFNRAWDR